MLSLALDLHSLARHICSIRRHDEVRPAGLDILGGLMSSHLVIERSLLRLPITCETFLAFLA